MEIVLIGLVILLGGAVIYFNRSKGFDVNSDGKVDAKDASAAVTNTVEGVKAVADVNKDGKVDTADVKEVAVKAKAAVKKTATKAKAAAATAAKKPGRKPKTEK